MAHVNNNAMTSTAIRAVSGSDEYILQLDANTQEVILFKRTEADPIWRPLSIIYKQGDRFATADPGGQYGSFSDLLAAYDRKNGFFTIVYDGVDTNAPITTSGAWWWNIIQFGADTRFTQIAFSPYRERDRFWIRQKHDANWTDWQEISKKSEIIYEKYSTNCNSTTTAHWAITATKSGYYPIGYEVFHSSSADWMAEAENIQAQQGQIIADGFHASTNGTTKVIFLYVTWMKF